ncbi:unnamed protein product [Moneuplotes crassus]|uniref:Uncharacterized protein n=1 Tax=Euplotes crassus TaxID=5936 RepID=A0AAD1U6S4_EUPCR|nr:unnamed protein product [Moneuplotes crassus]
MSDHNSDESSEIDEDLVDNIFANEVREARIFVSMLAQNRDKVIRYLRQTQPRDVIVVVPTDASEDAQEDVSEEAQKDALESTTEEALEDSPAEASEDIQADALTDTPADSDADSPMPCLLTQESAPSSPEQVRSPLRPRRPSESSNTVVNPPHPPFPTPPRTSPAPTPRTSSSSQSNQRREFTNDVNNYLREIKAIIHAAADDCRSGIHQIFRQNEKRIEQFSRKMFERIRMIVDKTDWGFEAMIGGNSDSRRLPYRREAYNSRIEEHGIRRREESEERVLMRETPARQNSERELIGSCYHLGDILQRFNLMCNAPPNAQSIMKREGLLRYILAIIHRCWKYGIQKNMKISITDDHTYHLIDRALQRNEHILRFPDQREGQNIPTQQDPESRRRSRERELDEFADSLIEWVDMFLRHRERIRNLNKEDKDKKENSKENK